MPHPFCTSTRIRLPPAGRPPLHRANARCARALKRSQTASEAFHGNVNGKGTPSGVPQPIHKRKLILVKEEFDASSFGGDEENRTPV